MIGLDTVTLLMTLVAMTSAQQYYAAGKEHGRLKAELLNRHLTQGSSSLAGDKRDSNSFDGDAMQKARWTGKRNVKDNQLARNQGTWKKQAQNSNHDFGKFSNNVADMAKQIRDQASRNSYNLKDDAQYQRKDLNSAQSANRADAKKSAFKKGDDKNDNIRYAFTKKFNKASSENGGLDEEHGRNFTKLNLFDEREQAQKLVSEDSKVYRDQFDEENSANHQDWKSSAAQRQAKEGTHGSANRREDQAGESSRDHSVDFKRKDFRHMEQERGKDKAVRLAKDLAQQAADYQNEASDASGAKRAVADAKYYNGKETGTHPASAASKDNAWPNDAAHAGVSGDKAQLEGNGGAIKSGFGENASQHEKSNQLTSGKAASSLEAVNDYQRNKNTLAHSQVRGLQNRSQGQSRKGLKDSASHGFSGNKAQDAKSAAESDKNSAAAQSASSFQTKNKNDNENLHSRNYYRKVQNNDNETLTHRKQFFHNKKQGGSNDERLVYDRNNKTRNYGATDGAKLLNENKAKNLHENGKESTQTRHFEDSSDRRNTLLQLNTVKQGAKKDFSRHNIKDDTQVKSSSNGFSKELGKSTHDDSKSGTFKKRQRLQKLTDSQQRDANHKKHHAHKVNADVDYSRLTNGKPVGEINSRSFIDSSLFRADSTEKGVKEHSLPNVVVNIQPVAPPPQVEQPKRIKPVQEMSEIQQVKTYHPPKYSKTEVNYDTGRSLDPGSFNQTTFSHLGSASIFQGPRKSTFNPDRKAIAKGSFSLKQTVPASIFGQDFFGRPSTFPRLLRGNYKR